MEMEWGSLTGTEQLLLNILIIVLAILVYFSIGSQYKYRKVLAVALPAAAMLLCMAFPINVLGGFKYDLRVIPLLIGILYGGYASGLLLSFIMVSYRYYLGGPGYILTLYSFPPVIVFALILVASFRQLKRKTKYLVGSGLALLWALICTLISFFGSKGIPVTKENILFYVGFCTLHALAMWIAMYLIESLSENEQMRVEIQRTEKLHALSHLAASIAHEVRNPLTVVRGFMQLLNEKKVDESEQKYFHLMIEELDRAEHIIHNFLTLAKPQNDEVKCFDAGAEVGHVVSVASAYASLRNVKITLEIASSLMIEGNPATFSQVLLNIIKNGIEAMPDGGTLKVLGRREAGTVIISIIDQGVGMTQQEVNQLGTPFYSSKREGTGLGLLTSFRIVQMMNGTIKVTSKKGKGTQFSIRIPSRAVS
ncbi:sensor histidine kinase [Ammoniphilus sp. CFH 90114]|uniref:ATP-binding protein n=1 Tax=Ammoniphilus sp. CFH 90114 TaxID=2493665 RepID=UPI00100FF114|nr:sensor histidine kinase [Ammoniphilus sp. CFH 90114]RXT07132.1 HAMP domain-containing histidine kinase [Ammoniphilus sp. CFH 90114]